MGTIDRKFDFGDDWSSLCFIRVLPDLIGDKAIDTASAHIPIGYVFVQDPKFGDSAKWKLAAGHKKPGETPLETAAREALGETGLPMTEKDFEEVPGQCKWMYRSPTPHWSILFAGNITRSLQQRFMNDRDPENEGEIPQFFTVEEFYALVRDDKFLMNHYRRLVDSALILPLERDGN